MPAYVKHLPVALNVTYVKASSYYSSSYYQWIPFDITQPVIGSSNYTAWLSSTNSVPQRINVDHGSAFLLKKLYLENYHNSASGAVYGIKTFRVYGTNSSTAFNITDGYDYTDLTLLGEFVANPHVSVDIEDPQYFYITGNSTEYRYTCFIFIDVITEGNPFIGFRRLVCYSEHESLDIEVSDLKYFTRAIVEQKLIPTKSRDNFEVVEDLWKRGQLKIKLFNNKFSYDFYNTSTVGGKLFPTTKRRRGVTYLNGDITTNTFGYLSGTVTVSGVVWPNAKVRLYYEGDGSLIKSTLTDSNGNFTFDYLEVRKSYYTVIAYKDGFNSIVYSNVTAAGYVPPIVLPPPPYDGGGDGETEWTPSQITTYLWLDANDGDTLTLDTNYVNEWRDKSSNAFVLQQTNTSIKPTKVTISGKSTLVFDGNDLLESTSSFPLSGNPAITVFIVYKKTVDNRGCAYGWGLSQSSGSFGLYDEGSGTAQYAFYSASYNTSNVPNNTLHIACVTKSASSGPMFAYRDSLFCGVNYTQPSSSIAVYNFVVGRWAQYGPGLIGEVAEIIVFNYFMNNPDRFKTEGYLANKWGLLDSLAVDHPFKSGTVLNYVSKFPLIYSSTTIKSTSYYSSMYLPEFTIDPTKPIVGSFNDAVWLSANSTVPQKLCVDYSTSFTPKRIYVDNLHHFGNSQGHTSYGVKTLEIYGSNLAGSLDGSAPNDLTNLTLIKTITLRAHIAQDLPDPQWFDIECDVAYRYIIYRVTELLQTGNAFFGIRHLEIQGIGNN